MVLEFECELTLRESKSIGCIFTVYANGKSRGLKLNGLMVGRCRKKDEQQVKLCEKRDWNSTYLISIYSTYFPISLEDPQACSASLNSI
jgi:hypothetical protein